MCHGRDGGPARRDSGGVGAAHRTLFVVFPAKGLLAGEPAQDRLDGARDLRASQPRVLELERLR